MDKLSEAIDLLSPDLKDCFLNKKYGEIEEIRLRCGKNPSVRLIGRELEIRDKPLTRREVNLIAEKACGASLQAHLNEIREGYISYRGLRIGLCGTAVYEKDKLCSIRNITSLNIRIPHDFTGDISELLLKMQEDGFSSTLIVSPPGRGKTSLLRELIRQTASMGKTVAVVDERNELACMQDGVQYFDLGKTCDVLTGVKKSEGAILLLRGMGPDIIAFDEISKREDLEAVYEIAGCGVNIFATAHGHDAGQLRQRPLYRTLLDENIFKSIINIKINGKLRQYYYHRMSK